MHGKGRVEKIDRCKNCYIMLSKHMYHNFDSDNSKMVKISGKHTRNFLKRKKKEKNNLTVLIPCISFRPALWNRPRKGTNSEWILVDQVSR